MIGGINSLNKILRILKNEYIFSIISKVMMVLIGMINSILIARVFSEICKFFLRNVKMYEQLEYQI